MSKYFKTVIVALLFINTATHTAFAKSENTKVKVESTSKKKIKTNRICDKYREDHACRSAKFIDF